MDSSIVTDSLRTAWGRTRGLLLTEPDVGRWLKYGFIAMLGAAGFGTGASVNFQVPTGPSGGGGGEGPGWSGPDAVGAEVVDAFVAALTWLTANIAHLLLFAVGLITVWLVLWLLVLYIRSVFRFIFVDVVAAPREPAIGASFHRHTAQGLSFLLWNMLLALAPLALIIVALVPIISSAGLLASGEPLGAVLGAGGMLALIGLLLLGTLLLLIGRALTDDFLVPAMYARGCGVVEGWRHVFRAWSGEAGNVIFFYLLKLLLGVGAAIAAGLVGLVALVLLVLPALTMAGIVSLIALSGLAPEVAMLVFGGPVIVAVVLGGTTFGYIVDVILLPVSVLLQAYSLAFVGRLDPSLKTI